MLKLICSILIVTQSLLGAEKLPDNEAALQDIQNLDAAVKSAPESYLPPNPETKAKLAKKLDFQIHERPFKQCLDWLSDFSKVPITSDINWDGARLITMDLKNATIEEIVAEIARQTHLEYVIRGRVVLFTTPERAKKLKQEPPRKN